MMGSSKGDPDSTSLMQKTVNLLNKAGYEVIFPEMINHLCCGTIWESKGMPDIADQKSEQLEIALMKASNDGEYPVLCDQSPCLYRMRKTLKGMQLYEPVEFIEKFLIEKLDFLPSDEPVTVFATCSTRKLLLDPLVVRLAKRCSTRVLVDRKSTRLNSSH